jgi:hypothetical protein
MKKLTKKRIPIIITLLVLFALFSSASGIVLYDKLKSRIINQFGTTREVVNVGEIKSIQDLNKALKPGHILFENLSSQSPSGRYYSFVTSTDISMRETYIWLVEATGENLRMIAYADEFKFFTKPVWAPNSQKLAFMRVYPFELWVYEPEQSFFSDRRDEESLKSTLVYSESEHLKDNVLNPALGFRGDAYLQWLSLEEIEFEDNKSVPERRYSINTKTKNLRMTYEDDLPSNIVNTALIQAQQQSQRDQTWGNQMLGFCEPDTIHSAGCAITAVSMMMESFDVDMDPDKLNTWLKKDEVFGYFNDCDIRWNMPVNYQSGFELKGAFFGENSKERLDYELLKGNRVVVGFNRVPFTNVPHWVFVVKKEEDDYIIRDPWQVDDNYMTLEDYGGDFDHMIVYRQSN